MRTDAGLARIRRSVRKQERLEGIMIKVNHQKQKEALSNTLEDEYHSGESLQISQMGNSDLVVTIIGKKLKVLRTHFININGEVRTIHGARHKRDAA